MLPSLSLPKLTLRARLLHAFILVVLLSGATISAVAASLVYSRQKADALEDIEIVTTLQQVSLDRWLASLHYPLSNLVSNPDMIRFGSAAASAPLSSPEFQEAHSHLLHDLNHTLLGDFKGFDRIWLVDLQGIVRVSTDPSDEGRNVSEERFFGAGHEGDYNDPPVYSPASGNASFIMVHQVLDDTGKVVALLAGRAPLSGAGSEIGPSDEIRASIQTFLVGADGTVLTPPGLAKADARAAAPPIRTDIALMQRTLQQGTNHLEYTSYRGVPVLGVFQWVDSLQVMVISEESQSDISAIAFDVLRVNVLATAAVMLFAIISALYLIRHITAPLEELTLTATEIEAGNLAVSARVGGDDEIGKLARAFNRMTARLREVIADLETKFAELQRETREKEQLLVQLRQAHDELDARVREQTAELSAALGRERQVRIATETLRRASMALATSLDLDTVLETMLDDLWYLVPCDNASIMLLQSESTLTVRASRCGEAPATAMRSGGPAIQFKDDVYLSQVMEKRVSVLIPDTDVERTSCGKDIRSDVLSWLGVPLLSNDRVIGLCSLEHSQPGFFTDEHARLAEAMAAHAGIAVQNAWLFEQLGASRERMQTLSRRLVEVQESERRFIARELHDEAGQALTGLKVGLYMLEQEPGSRPGVAEHASRLRRLADDVLENLHRLALNLRPASLDHLGLLPAVEEYIRGIGERYGLKIDLDTSGFQGARPSLSVETAFYRIIQEALHNVVRHASATRAEVILRRGHGSLGVTIGDNGTGFDTAEVAKKDRIGLLGMQERAEMLGGTLTVESGPGQGTTIIVDVPYDSDTDR